MTLLDCVPVPARRGGACRSAWPGQRPATAYFDGSRLALTLGDTPGAEQPRFDDSKWRRLDVLA